MLRWMKQAKNDIAEGKCDYYSLCLDDQNQQVSLPETLVDSFARLGIIRNVDE